jgi:serine/threonine protein phosphatase 1
MTARTIAIGDIHGCSEALRAVVAAIDPQPADIIVALGDFVDRGPDSRGVNWKGAAGRYRFSATTS